jgi:sporulation integral membrane protein YlbJ
MNRSLIRKPSTAVTVLLGFVSVILVAALVAYPAQAFAASLGALQFWWNIVFPAMLPYLILIRLAFRYGLTDLLGKILEPLARLLRLPRGAGDALSAGLLLGGTAGPLHTARNAGRFGPEDAALLAAASGAANPVLVLTVIGAALLHSPAAGPFLLAVHYAAWFLCALALCRLLPLLRHRLRNQEPSGTANLPENDPDRNDRRSFGHVLGDSVTASLQNMLELGGIMIVFAVIARMAELSGIAGLAADGLTALGMRQAAEWTMPVLTGILEMHNGIKALAGTRGAPLPTFALLGAVLAWGGIAAQLEIRSELRKAGVGYAPSFLFRLAHSVLACLLTVVLWPLVRHRFDPWPLHGEHAETFAAWRAFWPEVHGMPQAALYAAALSFVLLLRLAIKRLVRRGR